MAYSNTYAGSPLLAEASARATFIRKTYTHLGLAILGFVGLECVFMSMVTFEQIMPMLGGYNWLIVLGGFVLVGWVARSFAHASNSLAMQYLGLSLYVVAEAVIFVPLLVYAEYAAGASVIGEAGIITLGLFAGLTAVVFVTKKDFSFLRSILMIGGFVAMGMIVCSIIFGFHLGIVFSGAMVLLAAGAILYDTSKILHHYGPQQYVGAALQLFASVALLFWYVLRILIALRGGGRR